MTTSNLKVLLTQQIFQRPASCDRKLLPDLIVMYLELLRQFADGLIALEHSETDWGVEGRTVIAAESHSC